MKKEEFSLRDFYYSGKELYRNKKYNKAYFVLKKLLNNNAFVSETNVVATQLYIFCCFLIFYIIFVAFNC